MPDASSAEVSATAPTWPLRLRLAMLAWNTAPLLHVVGVAACWIWVGPTAGLAALYLLPPLAARVILLARPASSGTHEADSPVFLTWWATAQLQMIFCRLPFLEECLRLVPGLYSLWLRLWGARIGRLTFWSPGTRILDRPFLSVGNGVVFGAGVRINPHVIETVEGRPILHLGTVTVRDDCMIGGYSLLTAGTTVEAGESLKAFSLSPPFTRWENGRRARPAVPRDTRHPSS